MNQVNDKIIAVNVAVDTTDAPMLGTVETAKNSQEETLLELYRTLSMDSKVAVIRAISEKNLQEQPEHIDPKTGKDLRADVFPMNKYADARGIEFAESVIGQMVASIQTLTLTSEAHCDTITDYLLTELSHQATICPGMSQEAVQGACETVGQWVYGHDLAPYDDEGIPAEVALRIGALYLQASKADMGKGQKSKGWLLLIAAALAVERVSSGK